MHWKRANRLYSKQSLGLWGERLTFDWEGRFDSAELKHGRSLYKKGEITEISLNEQDVVMTCRVGRRETYSVVEWSSGSFSVRSSCGESAMGRAIAVAGFLEIEELLADEDLSILAGDGNGISKASVVVAKDKLEPVALGPAKKRSKPERDPNTRTLHLVLDTHYKGLICEAYWLGKDGSRVSALSLEDGAPRAATSEERGKLIVLAARARKSHFSYSPEFAGYLLENLREVAFFIQNVWPSWRRWFSTEERENVRHIQNGITEISVGAKAERNVDGTLDVQWMFNSGKSILTLDLADQLLAMGEEPALIPDLGIVKLSAASKSLIESWKNLKGEEQGEGMAYNLFSLFAESEATIELSPELQQWRESLLKGEKSDKSYLKCLRPYQAEGVAWMSRLLNHDCHCLLADEMGLGKTVQVIALIESEMKTGSTLLVVCPASVVPVWLSEFTKFAPRFRVGRYENRKLKKDEQPFDVLVISYSMLRTRIETISQLEFEYAVIDEAQFIKNPNSKVSRSCRRIRAKRRIALTGTPIENRPLDIWPTFQFLMPGLLGVQGTFEQRLAENPAASKTRLKAQITPFMLRRTKDQVAKDLPEKVIINQSCPVTTRQKKEYASICAEGLAKFGGDAKEAMRTNRFAMLSLLTRLRQVSCDPDLLPWVETGIEDSGKLMVLLEKLIEVLGTGHKVVIFSQFVRFLERVRGMIETSFPDLPIFELTGSTRNREKPVVGFQNCTETAAMIVSLKAASVGITLHSADYVFLLDPWWNPAVESQAIDRVHRIGQKNTVFVYKLIAEGTIEEKIQLLQKEKQDLFDALISDSRLGADLVAEGAKSMQALLALAQSR